MISNQIYIPLLCCTLSVTRGLLTFLTMAKGLDMVSIIKTREEVKVIIPTALGVGAVVDVILTVSLSYYIRRHMKRYLATGVIRHRTLTKQITRVPLVDTTLLWTIREQGLTSRTPTLM